jgi:ankyrin repeat protein
MPKLCYAAQNHDYELVESLLRSGADVNELTSSGFNAVMLALAGDKLYSDRVFPAKSRQAKLEKTLQTLIEFGADLDAKGPDDNTALHFACAMFPFNLELLVKSGADVNAATRSGMTPLMTCKARDTKILMEYGADPCATDRSGMNAFFYVDTVQKAKLLKKWGVPLDARDRMGGTALMQVVSTNRPMKVIHLFASFPALVDARDHNNNNALMRAANVGNEEAMEFLLTIEDPQVRNGQGRSLLMQVMNNRSPNQVRMLVESGCDVNQQDNEGNTALHFAAKSLCADIVSYLLEQGASAVICNNNDLTPMSAAIDYCICSEEILGLLIEAGAQDFDKARQRAIEFEKPAIVHFLDGKS